MDKKTKIIHRFALSMIVATSITAGGCNAPQTQTQTQKEKQHDSDEPEYNYAWHIIDEASGEVREVQLLPKIDDGGYVASKNYKSKKLLQYIVDDANKRTQKYEIVDLHYSVVVGVKHSWRVAQQVERFKLPNGLTVTYMMTIGTEIDTAKFGTMLVAIKLPNEVQSDQIIIRWVERHRYWALDASARGKLDEPAEVTIDK